MIQLRTDRPGVIVRLLSVPHTGTRFTMAILRFAGMQEGWYKEPQQGDYIQAHFFGDERPNPIIYELDHPVIIPLRDINAVRVTWERKGKSLDNLAAAWREMQIYLADHPQTYLLRIDQPQHRESDLQKISELLGRNLYADWNNKVGSGDEQDKRVKLG